MCYAKPGPRCASHLTADIKKLETEIKELEKSTNDTDKFKLVQKRSRLDTYRFAYDGTQKGQIQLQAALESMDKTDPDYRDIKKYKENARNEYDLKIRNFKEAEQMREEREAKKNDLLARKAQLEAEIAALDSAPVDPTDTPFARGRAAAEAGARKAAADKRAAKTAAPMSAEDRAGATSAHSYGAKGGYGGKGGSVAPAYRNPRSSPPRGAAPIGRTTSYAYGGKGFGGK